ncbi:EamA family transporter [Georgenia subflava]|uniref:EamA family transporter n=2 Tax=Georgenia subflava TaxID=1622177 RepID=A0A6N7EIG9_9MICO|nr:EamA family transporter [Georgenia subflava]
MGTAGLFGRMATPPGADLGDALTLGRMLVGALGMLALLAAGRRLGLLRRSRPSASVVLGGVFLGLSLATYLSATVLIDLALAVVLHYIGPVLATVLARVVRKERITGLDAVGLLVSVVGMALAAGLVGGSPAPTSDQQTWGTVLGVASGVFYGAALLTYRYRSDMPADIRSFWNFAFGALAVGAMVAVSRPDLSGMTGQNWAWAIAFFLICGLLALGLLVVAGQYLRPAELSGLSYLEVVVALLLGVAVYGESLSALAGIGAALVVIAALLPLAAGRNGRSDDRAYEPEPGLEPAAAPD